jgi:general secretion pathway protein G
MLKRSRTLQAGFSLIEMMLVLGIIAFIAAMVAQNVFKTGESAKRKQAELGVSKIASEVQAYYTDNGNLPSKIEDLFSKPASAANWRPYLKLSQTKDPWGNPFVLKVASEYGDGFAVLSYAADGKEGGTDRDADVSSAD